MKIYNWQFAPNCRRVRMFVLKKGLDLPAIQEVIGDRFRLRPEYVNKRYHAMVPILETKATSGVFIKNLKRSWANTPFVAGDQFSFAHITTLCPTDFTKFNQLDIPGDCPNFAGWYAYIAARPSAAGSQ